MACDVCGQDLKGEERYETVGVQVSLLGANPMREKVEEIFGKNEFRICHVCWLKSLGVKPTAKGHAEKPL